MTYRLNFENLEKAAAAAGDHTRYAIAKRTRLSQSTISRLANGNCQPSAATQSAILRVYQLPIDQLMTCDDEQVAA